MSDRQRNPATPSELDLTSLTAVLLGRIWIIVVSTVAVTAAFGFAAFSMTPVYRATTVLVPADLDRNNMGALNSMLSQFGSLAALAGINVGSSGAATEESLAVLRSREFTEGFITDNELIPELFYGRSSQNSEDMPTPAEAFKFFDRGVRSIARDARTGLVALSIEWRDRNLAAHWANELVSRVNAEMRARAIANANASVGYLEKELTATALVDTRAAISRLIEAQINQRMIANVTQEYAFRVVDRALPPDEDDPIRPRKLLMMILGGMVGLLLGIVLALLLQHHTETRAGRS